MQIPGNQISFLRYKIDKVNHRIHASLQFYLSFCCRFLYLHHDVPTQRYLWNKSFEEYIVSGQLAGKCLTLIPHGGNIRVQCLQDQFCLMSSISNYHWWKYICCDGQISKGAFHVNLHEHLWYHPSCDMTDENLRFKYLPKSPSNWLMYYILNEGTYPQLAMATLEQAFKVDRERKL